MTFYFLDLCSLDFYLSHILAPFSPGLCLGELFPVVCTNEPSLYVLSTPHEVLGSRKGEGEKEGGILIQITVKDVRLSFVMLLSFSCFSAC